MLKKRQEEIDWLRGFAVFLVILGHSIIVYPINLHEVPWCSYLYNIIYSFHMPLFFAISGYCFSMRESYGSYLIKKAKRLLFPYFVFAFGGLIPRWLLPGLVNGNETPGESILKILLYGGEYWFLYVLFFVFAVFPVIVKALKKNMLLSILILVGLGAISKHVPNVFCLSLVLYYMVPFVGGYIARTKNVFRIKDAAGETKGSTKFIILTAVCISFLISGYLHLKFDVYVLNLLEAFAGIIGCFVLTLIVPNALKTFGRYSDYSLAFYLLNGYFLVISRTLAVKVLKMSSPIMIIAINMIIDFYLAYLLIRCVFSKIPVVREALGIVSRRQARVD